MSSISTKKIQKLQNDISLIQDAMKNVPALTQVGKEIKEHLDKLGKSMVTSFWIVHKKELEKAGLTLDDLDITKTDLWKDFVNYMTDNSQNLFVRDKLSLTEYLSPYLKQYFEQQGKIKSI